MAGWRWHARRQEARFTALVERFEWHEPVGPRVGPRRLQALDRLRHVGAGHGGIDPLGAAERVGGAVGSRGFTGYGTTATPPHRPLLRGEVVILAEITAVGTERPRRLRRGIGGRAGHERGIARRVDADVHNRGWGCRAAEQQVEIVGPGRRHPDAVRHHDSE